MARQRRTRADAAQAALPEPAAGGRGGKAERRRKAAEACAWPGGGAGMDMSRSRRALEHECGMARSGHDGHGRMHGWALWIRHDELRRTVVASWPKATGNDGDDVLRQRHGLRFNGNRGQTMLLTNQRS